MLNLKTTRQFEKDYKKIAKSGHKNINKLKTVMKHLCLPEQLEQKYRDHILIGNYKGRRECHIEPDWLLIYRYNDDSIIFERTGSHSDLFNK